MTPVYRKWKEYPVTILASPGEVQLHLCVPGESPERADGVLDAMEADFREALGPRVFGRDGEDLAAAVGTLLRERGKTLALAESCTGGMISALVTDVPGSSDYFLGGVVSYADAAKENFLGVSAQTLRRHGAVSEEASREMARGARAAIRVRPRRRGHGDRGTRAEAPSRSPSGPSSSRCRSARGARRRAGGPSSGTARTCGARLRLRPGARPPPTRGHPRAWLIRRACALSSRCRPIRGGSRARARSSRASPRGCPPRRGRARRPGT